MPFPGSGYIHAKVIPILLYFIAVLSRHATGGGNQIWLKAANTWRIICQYSAYENTAKLVIKWTINVIVLNKYFPRNRLGNKSEFLGGVSF